MSSILYPTLYAPATTKLAKLLELASGRATASGLVYDVHRIVVCTEDSVSARDLPAALHNLTTFMNSLSETDRTTDVDVFVRVRNRQVMDWLLKQPNMRQLDGIVIPKADPRSLPSFAGPAIGQGLKLMPILEAKEMGSPRFRSELVDALDHYRMHIDTLRIGANDLMGYHGLRRPTVGDLTVYNVIGGLIDDILNEFRMAAGFPITAPVFECIGQTYDNLLQIELTQSVAKGLYGQTVIHPRHLPIIMAAYKVTEVDLDSAERITGDNNQAVAGRHGRMDEVSTHANWAQTILQRNRLFGVMNSPYAQPMVPVQAGDHQ